MKALRAFAQRLAALFRKKGINREMEEEMRFHLEMRTKENIADGMSAEDAHFSALRSFGGVEQAKEECREERTVTWIENTLSDLRYGSRSFWKNPGFTVVAVLTLAVGIGADTAIFSSANAILFRPLPFPDSDRLVAVYGTDSLLRQIPASAGDFSEWKTQASSFESLAVERGTITATLTGGDEPKSVTLQPVSQNYFTTLGVRPALGRDFLPSEDQRGKGVVVLLSHGLWQRQFGGRSDVINQILQMDGGLPVTIVGVMPADFSFRAAGVDMWIPFIMNPQNRSARYFDLVVGRLKPGVTLDQARSEMAIVSNRLAKQFPDTNKGYGANLKPLLEEYVGEVRPLMLTLLGAVGFLLLLCCVNIANLLLARALAREKEIVIRATLGASRGRIIRQFIAESLLLAALGGAFGVLIAIWGTKLLVTFAPPVPRIEEISVDGRALVFTCVITLLTGIAFGLVPALQATRIDLNDALKAGARGSTRGGNRARGLLVISEIALALTLLIGAGLFIRSLAQLQRVDPGFQAKNVLTAKLTLPRKKYGTPVQISAFVDQAIARISALPDVEVAGATIWMPLSDGANTQAFALQGQSITDPTKLPSALSTNVTPDYFRSMSIPLARGRFFTERDAQGAPNVVIINEAMARTYFAGVNPIGQRIGIMNGNSQPDYWSEIVGIVGNVKIFRLQDDENQAEAYQPLAQQPLSTMTFTIRSKADAPALPTAIRSAILSVDRDQPIATIGPLTDSIAGSFATLNFTVFMFAAFSGIALGLAAIGIYGVMAYFVTQRTREIGIRIALGAQRGNVLLLIFSQAARLVAIGLFVGLAGSFVLTQFLQSMLFGVGTRDPFTFAAVAGLLALVAGVACLLPALRATRIDPIVALRID